MEQRATYQDCEIILEECTLTVRNSKIERVFRIGDGGIFSYALVNRNTGENWILESEETIFPIDCSEEKLIGISLAGEDDDDFGFGQRHLYGAVTMDYESFAVQLQFHVYPNLPLIRSRLFYKGNPRPANRCILDSLKLQEKHCEWENHFVRAITDYHNNLAQTENGLFYSKETALLTGTVLKIKRTLQNDCLVLIKEAPAADEQVRYPGYDFEIINKQVNAVAAGLDAAELTADEFIPLYGTAVGFCGGADLDFSFFMQDYHEARHRFQEEYDGAVFSNTWGDRNDGKNLCDSFLLQELDASSEMGITFYQIDAGWQTDEKLPNGARCWNLDGEKFPNGLAAVSKKAEKLGITLGIWFEPFTFSDTDKVYAHYEEDIKTLTHFYRDYGARFFKLDGFQLLTYTASYRLEKMMQGVLANTDQNTFFNVDITNWPRTGLFGAGSQYGNLFLENRYTDWVNYYPHYTMRNLWQLANLVPTYRLQAEIPNVERNADRYEEDQPGDPLSPAVSGIAYAAACVLFASPLVWFEPSHMRLEQRQILGTIFSALAPYQNDILRARILPIGNVPNGACFTGFQAIADAAGGYLLFVKGKNANGTERIAVHTSGMENAKFIKLASNCDCSIKAVCNAFVEITLEGDFSFAVYRYETA